MSRPKKTLEDLPENWKDMMIEIAKNGGSDVKLRVALGCISDDLWYRFIAEEPEFSRTVKKCKLLCQQWWENVGQEGMFMGGKDNPFNATVYTFNMKNRFNWADRVENKTDVTSGGEKINMTVNFVNTDVDKPT